MGNQEQKFIGLSRSQTAIWAGQKIHADRPLYNMAHTFELNGPIHIANFRKAFQELINRVEIFRIVFSEIDGLPYQYVLPSFQYDLNVLDFRSDEKYNSLGPWIAKRAELNFDVSKPLFDSVLLQLPKEKFLWYLNIHHLVTDATSSTILLKDISAIYTHICAGTLEKMEDIPNFSHYLTEELDGRKKEGINSLREFWKKQIETLPSPPRLYGETNSDKSTSSRRTSLKLGYDLSRRIRAFVQQKEIRSFTQQLSLYNFFASLLCAYVYRISRQERMSIGTPVHNRYSEIHRRTPGLFIEFFALVGEVLPGDNFKNILDRTKLQTNTFLKYAQPAASSPELYRSYNVILNFITASFDNFDGRQLTSKWIHPGHSDPSHELRCHVVDFDALGEIEVIFDMNEAVFGPELRECAPEHFMNLLNAILDDVTTPIEAFSIITDQEKAKFLDSPKSAVPGQTVLERFQQVAAAYPSKTALRYGNNSMTYDELNTRAGNLATRLEGQMVTSGSVVGLYFYRSPEYIISLLAIMKLNATFVPVDADTPTGRIQHILHDARCQLILTDKELDPKIKAIGIPSLKIDLDQASQPNYTNTRTSPIATDLQSLAYIMYTSGSTGTPKGVMVTQENLSNYIFWAQNEYSVDPESIFPLFTSIGFDLTISSTFLPLIAGGELVIYRENLEGNDLAIFNVISDNQVNTVKLTPSHLQLLNRELLAESKLKILIVGGESLQTNLAQSVSNRLGSELRLYNEYGPTEATVGCIVHKFSESRDMGREVPIGRPISNMQAYVLDAYGNLQPKGVVGKLYVSGAGIARGYMGRNKLTKEKFLTDHFCRGNIMYDTGDLARWNAADILQYCGREDDQVKIRGYRIELKEIEANLNTHPDITGSSVMISNSQNIASQKIQEYCMTCGLPSNYPQTDFDEHGICNLCNAFHDFKDKTSRYFKTEADLIQLLKSRSNPNNSYDCLTLLSGGKDSSYVLARLVGMGLRVLAFTLDNGYISDQAKNNIAKIVKKLGVDHIYGSTPHMNKIFVDSLQRHQNVCNGCFKTIYTLSTHVALEKSIPFIVTGLSRGQFFETRLSEEVFWEPELNTKTIDDTILQARKIYHREDDAVKRHLDVSIFQDEATFNKVEFIDFYRYCDVSLSDMLRFLKEVLGWVRPTNTGRSTNCLINQAGIYVHKTKKGYSNYAFPYSWDVRLGHKTRSETLDEINEPIDVIEVERILKEIGYNDLDGEETNNQRLIAFYTAKSILPQQLIRDYLSQNLPLYMLPARYQYIEEFPLTPNGKIDKNKLMKLVDDTPVSDTPYEAPGNEIEELLEGIWKEVLNIKRPVGIHENFVTLGGHSLAAIRLTARANDILELSLPLNKVFELPSIAQYAKYIEQTLIELME